MHIHPMRVLFLIPTNPPPTLDSSSFSKHVKKFVIDVLKKIPTDRPTCNDLLSHSFITKTSSTSSKKLLKDGTNQGISLMRDYVQQHMTEKKQQKEQGETKADGDDNSSSGSSSSNSSGSDSDSDSDNENNTKTTTGETTNFDEDSDQDGKGDDSDDDWDFESRKFTKEELQKGLEKESNKLDFNSNPTSNASSADQEWQDMNRSVATVVASASTTTLQPLLPQSKETVPILPVRLKIKKS